ncbi:MAG: protein kinase [Paucibacter sp.]|nr:protein kinase [Roseateles sp.]
MDDDATVIRPPAADPGPGPDPDPDATVVRAPPATTARHSLAPTALPSGYRLHEYRISEVLGQGGFGITYLATDVNLNAQVAVKEYLPIQLAVRMGDGTVRPRSLQSTATLLDGLDQFLIEARTLATFRHPNIVRVARFFEANRTAYMVLDFERGQPLGKWWGKLPSGALAEPELLTLLSPLLDGLSLVHHKGVLHRDIKPDNILVRDADGSLVLLDFGAARASGNADEEGPTLLTPGYAPIEQYVGGSQGPWTDIYALGATLYWMVCGHKPREAPDRQVAPEADVSAEQIGATRYSPEFLRAIDWALQLRAEDRPQDVASLRRALFAAHAASLGLQEALASGTEAEGGKRGGLRLLRSRILRPPSWPLAVKMALALVLAAVLPMSITAWQNYTGSVEALASSERRNLERLALSTSGRLSQLIEDSRRVTAYVAQSPGVAELLVEPSEAAKQSVLLRLQNLVATNPDLHLLTLMDARGEAVVSTAPEVVGGNFAFRDYFKRAMNGRSNVTSIIVGSVLGRAGAYVAYPVRQKDKIVGVIVLRLRAETIGAIVDTARNQDREPFLIDGDGVVIHHRDEHLLFHSLAELRPEVQADIAADQRFRLPRVESLNMPPLAIAMTGARHEGTINYDSTVSKVREVAGFAPVSGVDWVVGVTESHASFEAPLTAIFRHALYSLAVVGAAFVLLALLFARSITRPVLALTQAADALKRGDYDQAHVHVKAGDEIGALGRTFNVMIDVLRQRERERGMRSGSRE